MKKSTTLWVMIVAVIATGSFLMTLWANGTATTAPAPAQRSQLARWLNLTEQQQQAVENADPDFASDVNGLQTTMNAQRLVLADLLENNDASDEQVMDQIEKVIRANENLERRAARHILNIRQFLEPQQRRRLMNLCATGVRQGGQGKGPRWRGGRGESGGGRGQGGGGGHGGGRGGQGGPQSHVPDGDSSVVGVDSRIGTNNAARGNPNCPSRNSKPDANATDQPDCSSRKHAEGQSEKHQCPNVQQLGRGKNSLNEPQ